MPSTPNTNESKKPEVAREPEFTGPGWKNPYVIYIILTAALFGFLILMGYIALNSGWIPNRGSAS